MINKNLCFYYWLKKRMGKNRAFKLANGIEKIILIFGRELIPYTINEVEDTRTANSGINKDVSLMREEK